MTLPDPIRLEVFKHLFAAVAEEMGVVLRKASYSPNIKERRDFSCALFAGDGKMISQAAHIPVHLGSMPLSVAAAIEKFASDLQPGDCIILNDPYMGGTHLPDITLVTPIFIPAYADPFAFVASRAHHADVGGMTPGSMPIAREIFQEGLIIPPIKLVNRGEINSSAWDLLARQCTHSPGTLRRPDGTAGCQPARRRPLSGAGFPLRGGGSHAAGWAASRLFFPYDPPAAATLT